MVWAALPQDSLGKIHEVNHPQPAQPSQTFSIGRQQGAKEKGEEVRFYKLQDAIWVGEARNSSLAIRISLGQGIRNLAERSSLP